jgi:methionine-rich copper-binding protein CopC
MQSAFKSLAAAAALALSLMTNSAFAHALLEKATPAVGSTVSGATELRLEFSEGVEPKFSGATLTGAGGAVALGKAAVDPSDNKILILKINKPLAAGVYTVNWHAVSVDTHHTQSSFTFTVQP